ncbi:MAG TPA: protein kinase [Holophagaceae bacterium]|nr:protein kinase [Holophagaceae bacterium]
MSLSAGLRLGPYEIVEPLGAGGMGEVWKARDTRLERFVAVKVLQGDWAAQPGWLSRFRLEAKAIASLNHPNILGIFDIGSEGQLPFAVMELLEGETLRARLSRGPLVPRQALDLAQQMAHGLAAAHEKGLIHRDLKPENLWITREGRLKILDFGLAKRPAEAGIESPDEAETLEIGHRTEAGLVLGTIGYMSPEQARGGALDLRSDLFSFGAVLWEMLMGRKAFARSSAADTLAAILTEDPPSLEGASTPVPPGLQRVVEHCLDKHPEGRFQSARDLAFALEAISEVPAARAPAGTPSLAVLPFVNLSQSKDQDYFSDGVSEEIINALMKVEGLRVAARTSSFAFKGKDEDARRIGAALGVKHLLEGSVRIAGERLRVSAQLISVEDGCQLWSDRFDRGLADIFEVQDEIARAIAQALEVKLLHSEGARLVPSATADPEAYDLFLRGRAYYNQRLASKAIECFEAAIARDSKFAEAYTGLADARSVQGYYGGVHTLEAHAKAREAAEMARRLDPAAAGPHVSMAILEHYYGWDFLKEEAELAAAIRINPNLSTAHYWMGILFSLRGMEGKALPFAQRSVELDPLNPNALVGLGLIHYGAGRHEEAMVFFNRAHAAEPAALLPMTAIARCRIVMGSPEAAVEMMEGSMQGPGGASTIVQGLMACLYAESGRKDEARRMLAALRDAATRAYVAPLHMGFVEAHLGDLDAAFDSFEKAVDDRNALAWHYLLYDPDIHVRIRDHARYPALAQRFGC